MNTSKEQMRKLLEDCWERAWTSAGRYQETDFSKIAKQDYITSRLAALDDGDGWEKLKEISDSPEKWLKMYDDYSEMLTKEDVASWWHDQYLIANAERNELKQKAKPVADGEGEKEIVKLKKVIVDLHDAFVEQFDLAQKFMKLDFERESAVTGGVKDEIIKAQDEYIKFLDKESAPFISFAFVHNMLVSKMVVNEGERHREKISDLKRIDEGQPAQGGKP